uniref:B box-type domain-containing protein n=1 Tax=Magallana gigas TaxID=29159 RepID=A0A8W8IES7_MAGGI
MEEWAKHFAANTLLNSLTKSTVGQPQGTCNMCAICLRDDKQVKAESWCHECQEMICETCKGLHKIVVTLRKHKITALALKNKTQSEDLQFPDMDEPCRSHAGKFMEVFCLDHEKLCCSVCFATKHRHCKHVEALEDIAKEMLKSNVDGNIEVLSKLAKVTQETIDHKEQTIREINAKKETILTNVSTEIENLKTKLDECQQQFEKTFLKTHDENEEKLVQCVLDLKRYLLTAENGQALLSAVQQKRSAKQTFVTAIKTIDDIEEQFQQFKANYSDDEDNQYEHDHTTILKQVCEKNKINDVTEVAGPSGTIWKLSTHLPSFRVLEHVEQKKEISTLFKKGMDALSLKAEKTSNFSISGSAHQGVFVDSQTVVTACSSPPSLKIYNHNGTELSCDSPIKLNGKPCLFSGSTQNVLYVGCLSSVYKLKIMNREENSIKLACVAEMKVKEDFDVFCIDEEQNRIIVASNEKITVFNLSPIFEVQTTMIPNLETRSLHSLCLKQDRFAAVSGHEVVCFSLSGQKLFQCQIPNVKNIRCLTFDPLMNVYVYSIYEAPSYMENGCCINCGHQFKEPDEYSYCTFCGYSLDSYCERCFSYGCAYKDRREVYQIISDGSNVRLFISDCLDGSFLFFSEHSKLLVLSDGTTCNEYKLKI